MDCVQEKPLFSQENITLEEFLAFLSQEQENLGRVITIDVRVFVEYKAKHIIGAIHANCSSIMLKRLSKGDDTVFTLVTDKFRGEFKSKFPACPVILYDTGTASLEASAVKPFADALKKQGCQVYFIVDGIKTLNIDSGMTSADTTVAPSLSLSHPLSHGRGLKNLACPLETPMFIPNGPSRIFDFLYLGNREDSINRKKLAEKNITHIINVTSDLPNEFESEEGLTYMRISVVDTFSQRIFDYFKMAFMFIENARTSGGVVFIHCMAGISRSATIVMMYIIVTQGMTLDQAFTFVKQCRPIISPNLDFMGALMRCITIISDIKAVNPAISQVDLITLLDEKFKELYASE